MTTTNDSLGVQSPNLVRLALERTKSTCTARFVLLILADIADQQGSTVINVDYRTLESLTGYKRRGLSQAVQSLIDLGEVSTKRNFQAPITYTLHVLEGIR